MFSKHLKPVFFTVSIALLGSTFQLATPAKAEEVYMIRGFLNVFSNGMNQMTSRLRSHGIRAKAISANGWNSIAKDIIKRSKSQKVSYPIIIAGHSLGGVEAVNFANMLGRNGINVSLVIGLDPGFSKPHSFRAGVKKVVNYKIPSGKKYRAGLGFSGSISNIDVSKYGADHVGIDKNRAVQGLVIRQIRARVGK